MRLQDDEAEDGTDPSCGGVTLSHGSWAANHVGRRLIVVLQWAIQKTGNGWDENVATACLKVGSLRQLTNGCGSCGRWHDSNDGGNRCASTPIHAGVSHGDEWSSPAPPSDLFSASRTFRSSSSSSAGPRSFALFGLFRFCFAIFGLLGLTSFCCLPPPGMHVSARRSIVAG